MNDTIENNPIITAKIKKFHGSSYDLRRTAQDLRNKSFAASGVIATERNRMHNQSIPPPPDEQAPFAPALGSYSVAIATIAWIVITWVSDRRGPIVADRSVHRRIPLAVLASL